MESEPTGVLLPLVMDNLSRQTELGMNIEDLEYFLGDFLGPMESLKENLDAAFKVGHDMGLLSVSRGKMFVISAFKYNSAWENIEEMGKSFKD